MPGILDENIRLPNIRQKFDDIGKDIETLTNNIENLENYCKRQIGLVEQDNDWKIHDVSQRVESMETRMEANDFKIQELQKDVENILSTQKEHDEIVRTHKNDLTYMKAIIHYGNLDYKMSQIEKENACYKIIIITLILILTALYIIHGFIKH